MAQSPLRGASQSIRETAHAKINLALHVRGRREDGYHELETLFAFVDAGDRLIARPAKEDRVTTIGEFAGGIENPFDNLVAKALAAMPRSQGLEITLEKNLPVAAGLGGGSADAGAVFRIVMAEYGFRDGWEAKAAALGADVPACVASIACVGRGTGTQLAPVLNDLEGTPVLLVNSRVPLATGPVFKAWDGIDRGPLPQGTAREIALAGRNDLTEPALDLAPEIGQVLAELEAGDSWLVRMSGSGATCFALYESEAARDQALRRIASERPYWWWLAGKLR
ncbi:4-(cytidine 5'-diphospho)-2-C-methyl-D-erythritol kinase [Qipengyuania nanhaisediminis]|uniref:4-(cytidine 5'-diphospho)-2-C-methyl-D-erythritol kinase n=1 Tax=Qipengyuania nanhaisediminis TaxID=604088 RepID=UPI0038B3E0D6